LPEGRWLSATTQFAMVARGECSAAERRDAGAERCATLGPELGFLVADASDRAPAGAPILLEDAGQELDGTPHYAAST
jgi:hypothetical protein